MTTLTQTYIRRRLRYKDKDAGPYKKLVIRFTDVLFSYRSPQNLSGSYIHEMADSEKLFWMKNHRAYVSEVQEYFTNPGGQFIKREFVDVRPEFFGHHSFGRQIVTFKKFLYWADKEFYNRYKVFF